MMPEASAPAGVAPSPAPPPSPPPPLQVVTLSAALAFASSLLPEPSTLLIGARWQPAAGGESLPLHDPSNGDPLARIARGGPADIDAAVRSAQAALDGDWGRLTALDRGRLLSKLGALVLQHGDALARLEAMDVGKPLSQARADVVALARYLEFYGGAADKLHGQTIPTAAGFSALTLREPHGVTGHIVPWNYPMQIIGRSVGAALAMGNACVLKPAEDACLTALAFARLAGEAGLPAGALNLVTGLGDEAGAALASHPGVDHLSFTGSVEAGKQVQAAAATHTAPVMLELGGKSAQIVFADADLDAALPLLVGAGLQNAGQTCSAGSRILVERSRFDEVVARMAQHYRALRVGPALGDPDVGPLVSARQRERVLGYLALAGGAGATIVAQAALPADLPPRGFYVAPTLVAPVAADHRLAQEEVFGPLQVVLPFDGEDEAVALANGTAFGLVAGVWTGDGARQWRVKSSGHGREKGFEALYGFSQSKTLAFRHG